LAILSEIMIPLSNSRSANIKSGQKLDALEGRAGVEAQQLLTSESRNMKTIQIKEQNWVPMLSVNAEGRSQAPLTRAKRPEHIKLRG